MSEARPSLREFQVRLNERLRHAADVAVDARLGLEIGGERWLVDLAEAGEIVPVPDRIVPVPLTQGWFKGLVSLRGALVGVCDLADFCGWAPTPIGRESRLLAFASRFGVNSAVLASRMLGLHNTDRMTRDAADAEADSRAWAGATWVDAQGLRWRELSIARLCSDPGFLSVSR